VHSFLAWALDEVISYTHPNRLTSGRARPVPIGQEAEWVPEAVWTLLREKISCLCQEVRIY